MEALLGAGLLVLTVALVLAFRWMLESNKKTIEMLAQSSERMSQAYTRATESTYKHLKEASPIGGLPRDLWLEQHSLKKRELDLREQQMTIENPIRQEALRTKLMRNHRLSGNGRITNPEG